MTALPPTAPEDVPWARSVSVVNDPEFLTRPRAFSSVTVPEKGVEIPRSSKPRIAAVLAALFIRPPTYSIMSTGTLGYLWRFANDADHT